MILRLLLVTLLLTSSVSYSQDTTWVQTFTFDSISTRRANFDFPAELDTMSFEKVLMYYKLKCDPLTPWDQYNCGEWDYLAYTRIFDHTGLMDSVQVDSVQFMNNFNSPGVYSYVPHTDIKFDTYVREEQERTGASTTLFPMFTANGSSNAPFDLTNNGGRFQMLLTAAELTAAGITAGDLQSLSLFVPTGGLTNNGQLLYPHISLKSTTDADITAMHTTGFTEVYNRSMSFTFATPQFADGENELLFHTPYAWNGTDNIIVEFYFENPNNWGNSILFENESTTGNMALNFAGRNGVLNLTGSNHAMFELSDFDFGDDVTIAFWAKGLGNTGVNTYFIEAIDTLSDRSFNIHFPWSNNQVYWDAGSGNGYDRINTAMTPSDIDNEWHHWAFVKDQSTGEMKILRDGVVFHSGTGLTRTVGDIHRIVIGASKNLGGNWTGQVDEFQIFNTAVDDATIASWYMNKTTNAHPNWADLLVYYDFDEERYAIDQSNNDYLLMPSEPGMIQFGEYPLVDVQVADRPLVSLGQGTVTGGVDTYEVAWITPKEPEVVFEFAQVDRHFEIVDAFLAFEEGSENEYDLSGNLINSLPYSGTASITNQPITYFQEPFEIIHDVEIGRFITPYGINFDLGPEGFTWIYDVSDYQMYLHGLVDLAAHNTQELIDLKFAFIEGTPPRDVHARQPIWSEWRSYSYNSLDSDGNLSATPVLLSDTSEMFKIKTRFTGHGHHGNINCCEWGPGYGRDHEILVDGVSRFNWEIWEETACGDNPNVSQGGTWPYAREGWCPGDLVKEYDHELTEYVTPGNSVTLDYDITDIPANDPDQGNGNYVIAMDLISYGAPNFQNDAAIYDIYNPNSWEYYGKWNPSCQNPRIILQNTGEQPLTSCKINVWVDYNNAVTYEWTGNLAFLEKEVVEIPITDYTFWYDYSGTGTFGAHVYDVNGITGFDDYHPNSTKEVKYTPVEAINGEFLVWFTTNNKANENQWRLMDSEGNTIFERTSLMNSTTYRDTFDLAPGCYSIVLEDNDNDGISFWYSFNTEGETAGVFRLKLVGGPVVEIFEPDFGNFHQYNFTVGFDLGVEELGDIEEEINVYPNPNDGMFDVEIEGNVDFDAQMQIFDMMGREVHSSKMNSGISFASAKVDMREHNPGYYIVKVTTPEGVYTKQFVKQ